MTRTLLSPLFALFLGLAALPATAGAPGRPGPIHHDLDVTLEPETRRLRVVDRLSVEGRGFLEIRLGERFGAPRVAVDGRRVMPEGGPGRWRVPLGNDAGRHEVVLDYAGELAAMADDGTGPAGGDEPRTGPEGSFLPAGTGWLPETPAEPAPYRLTVAVPAPQVAVATGRLTLEEARDGRYRAVFEADHPTEPPSLFAGPWQVHDRPAARGLPRLRAYLHPEVAGQADALLDAAAGYIAGYEQRIGDYPYDGFAVVSAPLPVGLGFPGLTYVGRKVLPLPFFRGQSLAHEVLHNWWGNAVQPDIRRGNWAEGLTTYLADHALAEARDPQAAREMRLAWLQDYAALPAERDAPLTAFTQREHTASQVVGYNKAAFVFHMLRRRLGDDAFDAGLRHFWQQHRFGTAGWDDLRRAFETASGEDLSGSVAPWLEHPGAPTLRLGEVTTVPRGDGFEVRITLRQDDPAYALSVPVLIDTAAGPVRRAVDLTGAEATATIAVPGRPLAVAADPDFDLFRRLLPGETPPILRDVTLDPATVTVIAAADDRARAVALDLAGRMLEGEPRVVEPAAARDLSPAPLLLVGTAAEVARTLDELGLGDVPETVAGKGSARVWARRAPDGRPVLAVMAEDAAALDALRRPLPHYGRQSYLVFEGRQAVDKGLWPPGGSPLRRRLG